MVIDIPQDLGKELENEIVAHIQTYVTRYRKERSEGMHKGLDLLEAKMPDEKTHMIDRELLADYLSLKAEHRASRDDKILQILLLVVSILAVGLPLAHL